MSYGSVNPCRAAAPRARRPARPSRRLSPRSRAERAALGIGLGGLALAAGLSAASALAPPPPDRARLAALAQGMVVCPDGWTAAASEREGVTEPEMMARYLAAAFDLPDDAVLRAAAVHLSAGAATEPGAEARIALCVAASRGLL